MRKQPEHALFVLLASPRGGAVIARALGLAVAGLVASVPFGSDKAALARSNDLTAQTAATAGAAGALPVSSCKLTRFAAGRVATVIDGRTFVLDDGRVIRLAAIEVAPVDAPPAGTRPRPTYESADAKPLSAGEAARQTLAALVAGRDVVVKYADGTLRPVDRYEQFVGYGFVTEGTTEHSLQGALLARGEAQLAAHIEPAGCRASLQTQEDIARRATLGLWADHRHAAFAAEKPAQLRPQRGRFAVVEGAVVSVRESHGTIYVNFSRHWSQGFSAFIRKRHVPRFVAAGLDLKRLEGRRVELRGYVEKRRGLLMAVEQPEQIAILESQAPTRP